MALALVALLLAPAQALATPPPSAEALSLAARVAQAGVLGRLIAPAAAAEVQEVLAAHKDLPADRLGRATDAAYAARTAAVKQVFDAEAGVLARALTPEQLRATAAFLESPAGRAYAMTVPGMLLAIRETEAGKDFTGFVVRRVCDMAQVCPPPPAPRPARTEPAPPG